MIKVILLTIALIHPPHPYQIFDEAGIPRELWYEYLNVAACESGFNTLETGDGGQAQGLFQIHWYLWGEWANTDDSPFDPVSNTQMVYRIQEKYSLRRHKDRWDQWTVKPHWTECQAQADEVLRRYE